MDNLLKKSFYSDLKNVYKKINLYIDCDGVILDTIATARRLAKEEGYDADTFDGLHEFFLKIDWNYLIKESGEIDNSIAKIKNIIEKNKYNVKILTKLGGNKTEEEAKRTFFERVLPGVTVITLELSENKDEKVNPVNSILIEDSLNNFRRWNRASGIAILFLKGDYIYDYPDEQRITEEEQLNIVDDIINFEQIHDVKKLLELKRKMLTLRKNDSNYKGGKIFVKTRHI